MKPSIIRDLLGVPNTGEVDMPVAHEQWLPIAPDTELRAADSDRLDWVNKIGRTHASASGICIYLPCVVQGDDVIPEIYNIRDIIDYARKTYSSFV